MKEYREDRDLVVELEAADFSEIMLSSEAANPGLPMNIVLPQAVWSALGREGRPWAMGIESGGDGAALRVRFANAADSE